MLELAILGFLAEGPMHGYELKRRLERLAGWTRPVSDGSLYPALGRLVNGGALDRRVEPGARAARRQVLTLTDAGRDRLLARLADPADDEVTDPGRWFTLLAFLSQLPERADRDRVLRRRLAFLDQPASFFDDGGRLLRAEDVDDPYRKGMLIIARATSRAERAWLREVLADAAPAGEAG